ncbi:MAG: hypothetical protein NTW87_12285, partial [Planctomycetota bacterium]|nr:hypothetical protein [Planctomycetota bacterium]
CGRYGPQQKRDPLGGANMLLLVALSSELATQQAPPADSLIRLPVRVHLLHSAVSTATSTTRTAPAVDTMFAFANTIWRQAGIEWVVESVVTEEATGGDLLDQLIAGTVPRTRQYLIALVPPNRVLQPGWNLFLIRDFGGIAGGVFLAELSGVILAERGSGHELPAAGRGGGTLAHELGHSLGLHHVTCDETHNIMSLACSVPGVVSDLTSQQIAAARAQAETRRPSLDRFEGPG